MAIACGQKSILFGLLAGCLMFSCGRKEAATIESGAQLQGTDIVSSGNYVYFITPLKDLRTSEKAEMLVMARKQVVKKLEKLYPTPDTDDYDRSLVQVTDKQLRDFVSETEKWLDDNEDSFRDIGLGMDHFLPTGFMLLLGGSISANLVIGGAGFMSAGLVMVPVKVNRVNKLTREMKEYYRIRWSAIVFPGVDLGAGVGGGAKFRAGVGMIWGELSDPKNFAGFTGGVTGSVTAKFGNNLSAGVLKQKATNHVNLYATAMFQGGPAVEAEAHGFGGMVFQLDSYLEQLGIKNGWGENGVPDPYEPNDSDWRIPKNPPGFPFPPPTEYPPSRRRRDKPGRTEPVEKQERTETEDPKLTPGTPLPGQWEE